MSKATVCQFFFSSLLLSPLENIQLEYLPEYLAGLNYFQSFMSSVVIASHFFFLLTLQKSNFLAALFSAMNDLFLFLYLPTLQAFTLSLLFAPFRRRLSDSHLTLHFFFVVACDNVANLTFSASVTEKFI